MVEDSVCIAQIPWLEWRQPAEPRPLNDRVRTDSTGHAPDGPPGSNAILQITTHGRPRVNRDAVKGRVSAPGNPWRVRGGNCLEADSRAEAHDDGRLDRRGRGVIPRSCPPAGVQGWRMGQPITSRDGGPYTVPARASEGIAAGRQFPEDRGYEIGTRRAIASSS